MVTRHTYPSGHAPGKHWSTDEAWRIMDNLHPGHISQEMRCLLAGMIAGALVHYAENGPPAPNGKAVMAKLKPPPVPCGSCPYRRDVPSGIWHPDEYDKLIAYDAPTYAQPLGVFMCHQRDGNLCGGWLACHGTHGSHALLSLRVDPGVDAAAFNYTTDVPVFASGAAARQHGIRDIEKPKPRARKMIGGLQRKRQR